MSSIANTEAPSNMATALEAKVAKNVMSISKCIIHDATKMYMKNVCAAINTYNNTTTNKIDMDAFLEIFNSLQADAGQLTSGELKSVRRSPADRADKSLVNGIPIKSALSAMKRDELVALALKNARNPSDTIPSVVTKALLVSYLTEMREFLSSNGEEPEEPWAKLAAPKDKKAAAPKKSTSKKAAPVEDSDDDDDTPAPKKKSVAKVVVPVEDSDDDDDDTPAPKKSSSKKPAEKESKKPAEKESKKSSSKKPVEEEPKKSSSKKPVEEEPKKSSSKKPVEKESKKSSSKKPVETDDDDDEEYDAVKKTKSSSKKHAHSDDDDEEYDAVKKTKSSSKKPAHSDDDDVPAKKTKSSSKKPAHSDDDDDVPAKKTKSSSKKPAHSDDDEETVPAKKTKSSSKPVDIGTSRDDDMDDFLIPDDIPDLEDVPHVGKKTPFGAPKPDHAAADNERASLANKTAPVRAKKTVDVDALADNFPVEEEEAIDTDLDE